MLTSATQGFARAVTWSRDLSSRSLALYPATWRYRAAHIYQRPAYGRTSSQCVAAIRMPSGEHWTDPLKHICVRQGPPPRSWVLVQCIPTCHGGKLLYRQALQKLHGRHQVINELPWGGGRENRYRDMMSSTEKTDFVIAQRAIHLACWYNTKERRQQISTMVRFNR